MRTNKRRNLNSGQWAIIANEAEEIVNAIAAQVEATRIEKQKANAANQHTADRIREQTVADENPQLQFAEDSVELADTENQSTEACNKDLLQASEKRDPNENATATKLAETFPTNRTYINAAAKMIETAPDIAAKVKAGASGIVGAGSRAFAGAPRSNTGVYFSSAFL